MSELMSLIQERRSIRKYEEKSVSDEALQQIQEAVRWAPSWANTQCWELIVVKSAKGKTRLQAALPAQGSPAVKAMVQAPVVLVLCAKNVPRVTTKIAQQPNSAIG